MAITEYYEKLVKKPSAFQCDVCKQRYKLSSGYDLEFNSDVEKQMAVLRYSYPAGSYCERTETAEVHCCSTACLALALETVPFNAKITIPVGGFFKRKVEKEDGR